MDWSNAKYPGPHPRWLSIEGDVPVVCSLVSWTLEGSKGDMQMSDGKVTTLPPFSGKETKLDTDGGEAHPVKHVAKDRSSVRAAAG